MAGRKTKFKMNRLCTFKRMDKLVEHTNVDQIEARAARKLYVCLWADCSRNGASHASVNALRIHVRKHTRERPFFCYLPGKFAVIWWWCSIIYTPTLFC